MDNPYNHGSVPVLLEALPRLVAPEGRLDLGGGLLNHRVAQVDVCNGKKIFEIEKKIFVHSLTHLHTGKWVMTGTFYGSTDMAYDLSSVNVDRSKILQTLGLNATYHTTMFQPNL